MYNIYLKDREHKSIYDLLREKFSPIPYHWNDNHMTIFD